jgi:putative glutamine amidotransferase
VVSTGERRTAPVVAVTGRALEPGRVARWPEAALASPRPYLDAVIRADAIPVVLQPQPLDDDVARALVGSFHALVLSGGPDVDPARYGQEPRPETYGVDPVADAFELALVRAALHVGRPTLAICRGIQVLNVALGGTLDQHITGRPGLLPHGVPAVPDGSTEHVVQLEPSSRLAAVMGTTTPRCSSHHHQAVERVADGLVVVGSTDDGIVEAVESPRAPWVLAVQWHPEDTAASDPAQQRLFDWLVTCERGDSLVSDSRGG